MSKVQMIVVDSGELYVFGKLISRHPEMPWLFSITDVYKACEKPIKGEAKKYGKDPEVTYSSKRPGAWLQWNVTESRIDSAASKIRRRIKKYGVDCGFQKSNASALALETLTNKQLCVFSTKGGSAKAKIHGTYVCQDFIVLYAGFLNDKLQSSVIDTFISVLNGYTEEVTKKVQKNQERAKGSPEREENIQINKDFTRACATKGLVTRIMQGEINRGVLGKSKKQYMKANDISEPFNDNVPIAVIRSKNIALNLAASDLDSQEQVNNKEGKSICFSAGVLGSLLINVSASKREAVRDLLLA